MIIDSTYFSSYLQASRLTITRLDDISKEFWLKDLFTNFPKKEKLYIHSFPQHDDDVAKIIDTCTSNANHGHIIILSGQIVDLDPLKKLAERQPKIYVLNDYGHTAEHLYPFISSHRTFGKGYIGQVPFVPWADRKYTISSLSSRYEPHRWILTGYLNKLQRDDVVFSFHNRYPEKYNVPQFLESAKNVCNFDVDPQLAISVQDLIDRAPIVPDGMNNPRPDGDMDEMTHVYDQCQLDVYLQSKVNLTMEGQFVDTGHGCNITEKTMKCLASGCFPLHVGQSGFYKFLSSMGFNFDVGIDLGYDDITSVDNRQSKIYGIMSAIDKIKANAILENTAKKNYDWFHKSWYNYCEQLNKPVMDTLKRKIQNEI